MKIIVFNEDGPDIWQTADDMQVMVSNRIGIGDTQIFCPARDVQIGDNVWEHNIVRTKTVRDYPLEKVKFHYGQRV